MTLAVWSNQSHVRMGDQIIGSTIRPAVTALPNGGYVIGWLEGSGLKIQVFDGSGNATSAVTSVDAVGVGGLVQNNLDIEAIGDDGRFIVSWNAKDGGGHFDLNTRIFKADLTPGAVNLLADDTTTQFTNVARVAAGADGRFVSTYMESTNLRFKVHNADGSVAGSIVLDSGTGINSPEVTSIGGNKFVVSYGQGDNINFQVVDVSTPNAPTPVTAELPTGPNAILGTVSEVVGLKDDNGALTGQFAVVRNIANSGQIAATFYDADGNPLDGTGHPVVLTTSAYTGNDFMSVTALRGGRIALAYSGQGPNDNDYIMLAIAKSDGSGEAPQTLVISHEGNQQDPRISEMADGRLVIGWSDPTEPKSAISSVIVDPRLAAVAVNGTSGHDVYAGSEHNGNVLNGAGGNDKLIGGFGSDQMNGGADTDTVSYERSGAGVTVDLANKVGAGGDAQGDTYTGIENAMGSAHGDSLTGDAGNNTLWGLGGNDTMNGGAGADVMDGGAGNDVYYVDGLDTVIEGAGQGYDTVIVTTGFTLTQGSEIESILFVGSGPATLSGNSLNNTLTGGAASDNLSGGAGDDVLNGGAGADVMDGGAGNDSYVVDNAGDVISDSSGVDTVIASVSYTLSANLENLIASGAASFSLTGNAFANVLTGNAGANKIYGKAGNDVLTGGAGKDVFVFDTKLNKSTNVDKILDFRTQDDSIYLDNKYFTKLGKGTPEKPVKFKAGMFYEGKKAHDRDDRIVYDKKTGSLYYDDDGSGRHAQVKIATLTNKTKLYYHDFFVI